METRAKQRNAQHLIDEEAQSLLRSSLPRHWVLHEYRPDYGIDYSLEVFRNVSKDSAAENAGLFETLGEHLFIQLKGSKKIKHQTIEIFARYNVEKTKLTVDKSTFVGSMQVISFPLEISELLTIQRMGAAMPVLLVVADLDSRTCHFLCLNDYIDKVLIPKYGDYTNKKSRTVHIPTRNIITATPNEIGHTALKWYAKRAKLYAAFQKFVYQYAELQYAYESEDFGDLARHFAVALSRYDFWSDTSMWPIIEYYGEAIKQYIEGGGAVFGNPFDREHIRRMIALDKKTELEVEEYYIDKYGIMLVRQNSIELWRRLAVLPRNYEEVCREWFLPTPVGLVTSY